MSLEEKLRLIKNAAAKSAREQVLDRELAYLARRAQRRKQLPAERAPRGIEEYVEGRTEQNDFGEFFVARQALPFGRPYGSLRIGDIAGASLEALNIFLRPARNGAQGICHLGLSAQRRTIVTKSPVSDAGPGNREARPAGDRPSRSRYGWMRAVWL